MKSSRVVLAAVIAAMQLFVDHSTARADEPGTNSPPAQAKPAEKGSPLPLHQIEGNGGIFSTLSAYIVNPPATASRWAAPPPVSLLLTSVMGRTWKLSP